MSKATSKRLTEAQQTERRGRRATLREARAAVVRDLRAWHVSRAIAREIEVGSLMPTLSAQPDPQVVYASSAGRFDSAVLRRIRDRGRAGGDESLAYVEWAAEPGNCVDSDCVHALDATGCVLDDRDRWQQANTAMGRRIDVDNGRIEEVQ